MIGEADAVGQVCQIVANGGRAVAAPQPRGRYSIGYDYAVGSDGEVVVHFDPNLDRVVSPRLRH